MHDTRGFLEDDFTKETEARSMRGNDAQFRISLPMRFRIQGERVWHHAWIDSMSLTEIIFRGDEVIEIGKTLDVRVLLPKFGGGRSRGTIASKAKITRSWSVSKARGQTFSAAVLTGSRLLRFKPGEQPA